MNYCRECREDFGGVQVFDAHRVGKHEYTYKQGIQFQPTREDGRRCLDVNEMAAKGWALNSRGSWSMSALLRNPS